MALPMHQRYEIVFLSQHRLGPKLGHKTVAKVVKCSTSAVQYWLSRWKQSKDLDDSARTGRPRATTPKQDQQILLLAEQHIRYKPRYYEPTEQKTSQDQRMNGATALERRRRKVQSTSVKITAHRKS